MPQRRGTAVASNSFHEPVMVAEVLRHLAPQRGGLYLDGTVGGGGHAVAILRAAPEARLLGLDLDRNALRRAGERLAGLRERVELEQGSYSETKAIFGLGEGALAGVLLDLGVSSHQIDTLERGFSFRAGAPLDMRMSGEGTTAADLLAELSLEEMTEIFRSYAEERRARRLAAEIAQVRKHSPIRTSDDLVRVIEAVWRRPPAASDLARIFQALRIATNRELEALERALPALLDLLAPGGRFVVISYHSLEDRRVKRSFRSWSLECVCPPALPICQCRGRPLGREVTRGAERPSAAEVENNARARSARLRAWERGA